MPEPRVRILTTDHTGFSVTSLEKALPFWTELLGFELLRQGEIGPGAFLGNVCGVPNHALRFALLQAPGHKVELLEYIGDEPRGQLDIPNQTIGAAHICFTIADLDGSLPAFADYGWHPYGEVQVLAAGPRAGARVAYISNEDGLCIELMQPPAA